MQKKMQKNHLNKYLTTDEGIRHGQVCFEGTRIPVADIFEYLTAGWSISKICRSFPAINKNSLSSFIKEIGNGIESRYAQ